VILQGFKSYRDQTILEPFSPHHNVIVGRNGSGKSNLFWAIRFALNDAYTSMSREERQSLLHEGPGPAALSAYVEIVFDNSDNRFPTGLSETLLRRTIGLKKDEFSLDRKAATKTEVASLLESAGFSPSNPYYIVPQGRITALCHDQDSQRFQLIKEIAGTQVYETKKSESIKLMDETQLKKEKIHLLMKFIEDRLDVLAKEKDTLEQFTTLDKEKKCLEYAMLVKELNQSGLELDQLNDQKASVDQEKIQLLENLNAVEYKLQETEAEEKKIKEQVSMHQYEKESLRSELAQVVESIGHFQFQLQEAKTLSTSSGATLSEREQHQLNLEIESQKSQLNQLKPQLRELLDKQTLLQSQIDQVEWQRTSLIQLQSAETLALHQSFLKKEFRKLEKTLPELHEKYESLLSKEKTTQEHLLQLRQELDHLSTSSTKDSPSSSQTSSTWTHLKHQRDQLSEQRKDAWREEAKAETTYANLKETVHHLERSIFAMMDRSTALGLQSIQTLVQQQSIQGVHGPLYTLMDVPEPFRLAVEVVAGSSLFNIVVDNDQVASTLLKAMQTFKQGQSGRVTFMPLNRLTTKDTLMLPGDVSQGEEVLPMLDQIEFDPMLRPAFQQVFGKALICPDLDLATKVSKETGFTVVTLQGDRVDKRGALSGGYMDIKQSRLESALAHRKALVSMQQAEKQVAHIKQRILGLDQQITGVLSKFHEFQSSSKFDLDPEMVLKQFKMKQKQIQQAETSLLQLQKQRDQLQREAELTQVQIKDHQAALATSLSKLTSEEAQSQLRQFEASLTQIKRQLLELEKEKTPLETEIHRLETSLHHHLLPKKLLALQPSSKPLQPILLPPIPVLEKDLLEAQKRLQRLETQLEQLDLDLSQLLSEFERLQPIVSIEKQKVLQQQRQLETHALQYTRFLQQRKWLMEKQEDIQHKIRSLGALPDDFQKYQHDPTDRLTRALQKVQKQLQPFGHVNKRAYEQFQHFSHQRSSLQSKKRELDESEKSIQDLMHVLDQRKDEALDRTFQSVATHFANVWEQLVPQGQGTLTLHAQSEGGRGGGVAIKVRFDSSTTYLRMQQLSGGQKSLVALSLIFAIQQCDPAPFYLFDEIDANLDPAYRHAVAHLLYQLSRKAQFIITTFRSELLDQADQFYGVSFVQKASHVQKIEKQEALGFVESSTVPIVPEEEGHDEE
ncbi:Structural maintenance of chromosomes protein 3, partial [Coelomomyces lativittatus]